jgi:prevent-host-death family protein
LSDTIAIHILPIVRTALYGVAMRRTNRVLRKGAEDARNQLPELLDEAEQGRPTIITRHGRPVAALVPIGSLDATVRQQPLIPLIGTGRGLWGKNSTIAIRKLRDEWNR